jgi:hypothetical protein
MGCFQSGKQQVTTNNAIMPMSSIHHMGSGYVGQTSHRACLSTRSQRAIGPNAVFGRHDGAKKGRTPLRRKTGASFLLSAAD